LAVLGADRCIYLWEVSTGKTLGRLAGLRQAVEMLPDDQQSQLGLGQALLAQEKLEEADEVLLRTIAINEHTRVAEQAKGLRSKLAHSTFQAKGGDAGRFDAVAYCLGAIERFEKMSKGEVQKIGFEIAILGMKGLDVNDPTQKYQLKSLPGAFSGLHLLCLMYVAFKIIDASKDVGFDLSKEYEMAVAMHGKKAK
jgi:hypothetical protein